MQTVRGGYKMNMPKFTAEASLYMGKTQYNVTASHYSQKHDRNSAIHVHRNIVPQLPIKLGQVCSPCIPEGLSHKYGSRECCDFYCDLPSGYCWKGGCTSK